MPPAAAVEALRAFELADPTQRDHILRRLVDRITDDEAASLDHYLRCKKSRFDVLGNLPIELQLCIVNHLEIKEMYLCSLVCHNWRDLFLHSETVVNHLQSTHFAIRKDGIARESSLGLLQYLKTSFFRSTGRFRTRLTLSLRRKAGESIFPGRLEGLKHGHTYQDLTCAASSLLSLGPNLDNSSTVSVHYSHGRIAWQQRTTPASNIVVHDLRRHQQEVLKWPRSPLIAGLNAQLVALGDELLVAADGRIIYCWRLDDGMCAQRSTPSLPTRFVSQGDSVLVTCRGGKLYLWEFSRQLREVNVTIRPNEPQLFPSPLPPGQKLIFRLHRCNNPVFFHPTDHLTFFVASYWAQPWNDMRIMLFVHEFQRVDGVAQVVRCFCRDVGSDMPSDLTDVGGPYVMVQRVDSRGTFHLLTISTKAPPPNTFRRIQYVTFNPLTSLFGVQLYEDPLHEVDGPIVPTAVWEKQMFFPMRWRFNGPRSATGFGVLNQLDRPDFSESPPSSGSNGICAAVELSLARSTQDVARFANMIGSDLHSHHHNLYGFEFACRLAGESCTFQGRHVAACSTIYSLDSVLLGRVSRYSPTRRGHEHASPPKTPRITEICVDDDLVIVVTDETYTVFYVDAEGDIADAIQMQDIIHADEIHKASSKA